MSAINVKIIGKTRDQRTQTPVIYAQIKVEDYLNLVGEDFDKFNIQRKREKHKAYIRLKNDIKNGALLPSITLSVKMDYINDVISKYDNDEELSKALSKPNQVNILDGLQRTFILNDIRQEGHEYNPEQMLLVEFWLEKEVKHLIYRLIVLNAGQKPMSMRHQVELLFGTIKEKLEQDIPDLTIYLERDNAKRNRSRKYSLDRLVTAYESYLTKSPEINRENIIAQELIEGNILDSDEESLGEIFNLFQRYLSIFADIDVEVFEAYSDISGSYANWLTEENVINSFFAAIADFGSNNDRVKRINRSLDTLLQKLIDKELGDDPLGITVFDKIKTGFNTKKVNVGYATRKLLMNGFKEYFREEGIKTLAECWTLEAQ